MLDDPGFEFRQKQEIISLQKRSDQFWTDSYSLGRRGSFPRGTVPGRKVEHSAPSSVAFKNEWSIYPFTLHAFMECVATTLLRVFTELSFCPIAVAVQSMAWVCFRLLGLRVRISPGAWLCVSCDCIVLSHRGVRDGPIPRPEESYQLRARVCVHVCVRACVCVCRWLCHVHQLSSTPRMFMYKKVIIKNK